MQLYNKSDNCRERNRKFNKMNNNGRIIQTIAVTINIILRINYNNNVVEFHWGFSSLRTCNSWKFQVF